MKRRQSLALSAAEGRGTQASKAGGILLAHSASCG